MQAITVASKFNLQAIPLCILNNQYINMLPQHAGTAESWSLSVYHSG